MKILLTILFILGNMNLSFAINQGATNFVGNVTTNSGVTSPWVKQDGTTTGATSQAQTFTDGIIGSVTGNASTATALASSPTNCSSNQAPTGINASGTAQNCTAYLTSLSGALLASGTVTGATSQAQVFTDGVTSNSSTGFLSNNAGASVSFVAEVPVDNEPAANFLIGQSSSDEGGTVFISDSYTNNSNLLGSEMVLSTDQTPTDSNSNDFDMGLFPFGGGEAFFISEQEYGAGGTNGYPIDFSTQNDGASAIYIDNGSAEHVGIGYFTSTPAQQLEVNGEAQIDACSAFSGHASCWATNGAAGYCTGVVGVSGLCSCSAC